MTSLIVTDESLLTWDELISNPIRWVPLKLKQKPFLMLISDGA